MASSRTTVAGLRELGEAMRGLSADINKRIARSATNAAGQVIKKAAQLKAPSDTGNLRKNIIVKRLPPNQTKLTSEHIVTVRRGKLTAKQQATGLRDAYYASFVEFGTAKASAQPFLRPAFDTGKGKAVDAMAGKLAKRIAKGK